MNFRHSWILLFEFPATVFVTTNYTVTQIYYLYVLKKRGHFLCRLAPPWVIPKRRTSSIPPNLDYHGRRGRRVPVAHAPRRPLPRGAQLEEARAAHRRPRAPPRQHAPHHRWWVNTDKHKTIPFPRLRISAICWYSIIVHSCMGLAGDFQGVCMTTMK